MGEVVKGGIFKPCCRTIRYSQITGALRHQYGTIDIHACGYLDADEGVNRVEYLIYSPRDRGIGTSKLPLQVEYLTHVRGRVFVVAGGAADKLSPQLSIGMGAMLSKGFGNCRLTRVDEPKSLVPVHGTLKTRIPLGHAERFGIRHVFGPVHGYLYEPAPADPMGPGEYVLSLFEGSEVMAPACLIDRRQHG